MRPYFRMRTFSIILVFCFCISILPTFTISAAASEVSNSSEEATYPTIDEILGNDTTSGTTVDGLDYVSNATSVVVTGYSGFAPDVVIPKTIDNKTVIAIAYQAFNGNRTIETVVIDAEITAIPDECFRLCSNLKSFVLPDTITSIGDCAFMNCNGLTEPLEFDGIQIGSEAFGYCSKLTEVTVKNIPYLDDFAFIECKSLTTVNIENVDTINFWAFKECTSLTDLNMTGVQKIANQVFYGCNKLNKVILPDGLTRIGEAAFAECTVLSGVYIPASVSYIADDAFLNDSFLSIYGEASSYAETFAQNHNYPFILSAIPSYSTGMGTTDEGLEYAYSNSTALITGYCGTSSNVIIPKSIDDKTVSAIAYQAFKGNRTIETVVIDAEITAIPDECFRLCSNLKSFVLPDTITSIGDCAFMNCNGLTEPLEFDGIQIGSEAFGYCSKLTEVTVKNIPYLDDFAFIECKSLTTVNIENVDTINFWAFKECTSLTDLNMTGVQKIANQVFYGCNKLNKVILPDGLTRIGEAAFAECTVLSGVYIPASVSYIADDAFLNDSFLSIYGEASSYAETFAQNHNYPFILSAIPSYSTGMGTTDEGLEYAYSNSTALITGYCGTSSNVIIPKSIDDKTVSAIAYQAFKGNRTIETVVIDAEITAIPDECFRLCSNLKSFVLPDTITSIGDCAFMNCNGLTEPLEFDGIQIGSEAFGYCSKLTEVTVKNIPYLDDFAFIECKSLTTVNIENVDTINFWAFKECTSLTDLNMTGVQKIANQVFYGCDNLNKVILPDGLTRIGEAAFAECTVLSGVYIPASVSYIARDAFENDFFLVISAEADTSRDGNSKAITFAEANVIRYAVVNLAVTQDGTWCANMESEELSGYDGSNGLYLMSDDSWVHFNTSAVGIIEPSLKNNSLVFSCNEVSAKPSVGQASFKSTVESALDSGGHVYDLSLTNQNQDISFSSAQSGSACINLPCDTLAEDVYVYHIDDDGTKTRIVSTYDSKEGRVSFNTTHFSYFSVEPRNKNEVAINEMCNEIVLEHVDGNQILMVAFYAESGRMISCEFGTTTNLNDIATPDVWHTCKVFLLTDNYVPEVVKEVSSG